MKNNLSGSSEYFPASLCLQPQKDIAKQRKVK